MIYRTASISNTFNKKKKIYKLKRNNIIQLPAKSKNMFSYKKFRKLEYKKSIIQCKIKGIKMGNWRKLKRRRKKLLKLFKKQVRGQIILYHVIIHIGGLIFWFYMATFIAIYKKSQKI